MNVISWKHKDRFMDIHAEQGKAQSTCIELNCSEWDLAHYDDKGGNVQARPNQMLLLYGV